MPHYKDGSEAKVGDVVKGKGYNVPHTIVGTVVGVVPGSDSCNIQVAHVITKEADADFAAWSKFYDFFDQKGVVGCGRDGGKDGTKKVLARVGLEYGQCDAFEKIG